MIYFTSDLHFGHDRGFIYEPRGFISSAEHDSAIIDRWNAVVKADDTVFILGDLMLGDNSEGIEKLKRLNGNLHIILGNHDTDTRTKLYKNLPNVQEVVYATKIKAKGYRFYLSHYPTLTANMSETDLKAIVLNLHGHTHSPDKFERDNPYAYNVAIDAHNGYPVSVDEVIKDITNKYYECKRFVGEDW